MILSALNDYYQRLLEDPDSGISPPGYSLEKISYTIVLDKAGNVVAVDDIRDVSGKRPAPRGLIVPQAEKKASAIRPNFLWEKTSYALGISLKSNRVEKEHNAFKEFHRRVLSGADDEGLLAFLKFLDAWNPARFVELFSGHGEEFKDSNVVFRLDGDRVLLHQRQASRIIREMLLDNEENSSLGTCLVSGRVHKLARLHPSVKGVNGAKSSGASIVSFNLDSFSSYGKTQGENAPISEQVAFAYTTALNHLLRRGDHNRQRLQIGDATVVFWAEADEERKAQAAEDLFADFLDPKDVDAQSIGRLRDALEKVSAGVPLSHLGSDLEDDTQIFILGLAPNASRLSIRFWEVGSLKMFAKRLAAHYDDLKLEPLPWRSPPAVWRLLLSAAPNRDGKPKSEDVPPQMAGELARAILTGHRYPYSLLSTLIMRMRADGDENAIGTRAALIKAILVRAKRLGQKSESIGEIPVSLDTTNTSPGYLLGRLFSVLESIQRAALGSDINATIRDRFYGSASATPASVFPMLVRNAQHHLSRLRKDKPGFAVNLEKDISDILDLLGTSFPKSLGLEAQGHFTIGYYHQTKVRFSGKSTQEVEIIEEGEKV